MNFPNAHTVNINGSTLNDVGGDYIVNTALPGERGAYPTVPSRSEPTDFL